VLRSDECRKLLEKYKLPANIVKHSENVSRIAVFLAESLKAKGIDLELVKSGGLLHDLDKMMTKTKGVHGEVTAKILSELGEVELAEIAKRHCVAAMLDPKLYPLTWEQKLVYYSDKRIRDEGIVSLDERFHVLSECYKDSASKDNLIKSLSKTKELEQEIFANLDFSPDELKKMVEL